MKLLEPTKNKITKDENGENVSYLEITGVVLIHRSVLRARIWWPATWARKWKVPGSSSAATYMERWALCSNGPANVEVSVKQVEVIDRR